MKQFHQLECRAGLRFKHRCRVPVHAKQLFVDVEFGDAGRCSTPAEVHVNQVDTVGVENNEILVDITTKYAIGARLVVLAELYAQSDIA